jgi:small nuclear ribonucleoprotein (snRNP)-like protein
MIDGRVAQGKFICLDRLGNIVLEDVIERREMKYHNETDEQKRVYRWDTERCLSQAVIPGDRLARVQIDKDEYQRRVGSLQT